MTTTIKIYGPPGTGKTFTLLSLIETLMKDGVPAHRIGFVSFTRNAVREAVTRACKKFGLSRQDLPFFRTLHSMALRACGADKTKLLTGNKLAEYFKYTGYATDNPTLDDQTGIINLDPSSELSKVLRAYERMKGEDVSVADVVSLMGLPSDYFGKISSFSERSATFKSEQGVYDFSDLIERFCDEGEAPKLQVLIVDEAQDLNTLQWKMVRKLATTCDFLYLAGDDDQAIYQWAGARPDLLQDYPCDETRVLKQSYRLPQVLHDIAEDISRCIGKRTPKDWVCREGEGRYVQLTSKTSFVTGLQADRSTLVLARTRNGLAAMCADMRAAGWLYVQHNDGTRGAVNNSLLNAVRMFDLLRDGSSVPYAYIKDFIAVSDPLTHGMDPELAGLADFDGMVMPTHLNKLYEFSVGLRVPGELGDDPRTDLFQLATYLRTEYLEDLQLVYRACVHNKQDLHNINIRVSTIHAGKGSQADHVVLLPALPVKVDRGRIPDEEWRVWYVAATRARVQLDIVRYARLSRREHCAV
jgi:DNA helicase II / ATP-dependent DNA helicase PcrA